MYKQIHISIWIPNNSPLYINTASNRLSQIITQVLKTIDERLLQTSSNETILNSHKPKYEKVFKWSGFKINLKFKKSPTESAQTSNRSRRIISLNSRYSKNIRSKIAKFFLNKHFLKSEKLHKILNRNTVKVTPGCTENMEGIQQKSDEYICQISPYVKV